MKLFDKQRRTASQTGGEFIDLTNGIKMKNDNFNGDQLTSEKNDNKNVENGMGAYSNVVEKSIDKKLDDITESNSRAYVTISILILVNLLNYMDRYTVAAVLIPIQQYFDIDDSEGGLLNTVFICSYMIFAPICGYLGDRYSRKLIMIAGIFVWSLTVLLSSFVKPQHFWIFFVARGIVGIGEASYSTVSPTIIADLFTKDKRSRMLMAFYFAIPVGSGLGYIVGGGVAAWLQSWQWGVRVTPILGVVCLLLLIFVLKEPERGVAEGRHHLKTTAWREDLIYLFKNKTFMLSSFGFVAVAFVSGAVSFWAPQFVIYSQAMQLKPVEQINLMFGFITCISGFAGVAIGSLSATRWRKKNRKADSLVSAIGLLLCLPFYYIAINIVAINLYATWVCMFLMVTGLCVNWALLVDILMVTMFIAVTALFVNWSLTTDVTMYVVIPTKRSSANAVQILLGHLLGDAFSPYIVGKVSDVLLAGQDADFEHFLSLKYALFIPSFVIALGSLFFFIAALYVEADKAKADFIIKCASENAEENRTETNNGTVMALSVVTPLAVVPLGASESFAHLIPSTLDTEVTVVQPNLTAIFVKNDDQLLSRF